MCVRQFFFRSVYLSKRPASDLWSSCSSVSRIVPEFGKGDDDRKRYAKPKRKYPRLLTATEVADLKYLEGAAAKDKNKRKRVPEGTYIGTVVSFDAHFGVLKQAWVGRENIKVQKLSEVESVCFDGRRG